MRIVKSCECAGHQTQPPRNSSSPSAGAKSEAPTPSEGAMSSSGIETQPTRPPAQALSLPEARPPAPLPALGSASQARTESGLQKRKKETTSQRQLPGGQLEARIACEEERFQVLGELLHSGFRGALRPLGRDCQHFPSEQAVAQNAAAEPRTQGIPVATLLPSRDGATMKPEGQWKGL